MFRIFRVLGAHHLLCTIRVVRITLAIRVLRTFRIHRARKNNQQFNVNTILISAMRASYIRPKLRFGETSDTFLLTVFESECSGTK